MKNLLLLSITLVLFSTTLKAQTKYGVRIYKDTTGKVTGLFADIPASIRASYSDTKGEAVKKYITETVMYIFIRDGFAGEKMTIWSQRTNSTQAIFLGESNASVSEPFSTLLAEVSKLKQKPVDRPMMIAAR